KAYPVEFYLFSDGLFVTGAAPDLKNILGCKVARIGKATAEEALAAARPMISRDNEMGVKLQAPMVLQGAESLCALRVTDSPRETELIVENPAGKQITVKLQAGPREAVTELTSANSTSDKAKPLYLSRPDDFFWYEYQKDRKLVYFQFNAVADKHEQTLA